MDFRWLLLRFMLLDLVKKMLQTQSRLEHRFDVTRFILSIANGFVTGACRFNPDGHVNLVFTP